MLPETSETGPRDRAVIEVARALYWLDSGQEAKSDRQALDECGNRARTAVQTMQRLGWHYA